jgi:hypothetical protein
MAICYKFATGLVWAPSDHFVVGAHIVDSGYDGEVFIDLHNIGTEEQFIGIR